MLLAAGWGAASKQKLHGWKVWQMTCGACQRLPPPPQQQRQQVTASCATSCALASALVTQAQALAVAAAQQSINSVLRRGGGMLALLPNPWGDQALPLHGHALVAGVAYSHYSILQLMTRDGLLLSGGPQEVSVRVAGKCCDSAAKVVGAWSKDPFKLTVEPQHALLLHSQPPKPLGVQFRATSEACTHTHEALYGWSPDVVTAELGKPGGY